MKPQYTTTPAKELPLQSVQIISMQTIGRGVFVMRIPRCADFRAGQVIGVTTTPTIAPRLYSLCSGTEDPYWEILFNIKQDGQLSPKLAKAQPQDTVQISMPVGTFIDDTKSAWWIAAGTGIAPFRAMLRSGRGNNKYLIHGARNATGFYFANEFMPVLKTRYIRCCSQAHGEGLYAGRLTHWLQEQPTVPIDTPYYLCGSAEMVVQVRDILLAKGVPFANICSEIYF